MAKARIKTARTDARNIRNIATTYVALQGGDCPTVESLKSEKQLQGSSADPWGNVFKLECTGDDVIVTSFGPDGQEGSEDDIQVPESGAFEG